MRTKRAFFYDSILSVLKRAQDNNDSSLSGKLTLTFSKGYIAVRIVLQRVLFEIK